MNLFHLRYFTVLSHVGHYGRAAEQLNITQPNLSYAIRTLEEELGIALFEKEGRKTVLTKAGRTFLAGVEQSLATLDSVTEAARRAGRGEGCLDIGFLRVLGIEYIPQLLSRFRTTEDGDRVTFRFHGGNTADLLELLRSQTCDAVFCSKDDTAQDVLFEPVAAQELVLIVPEGHPLAARDSVRLEETLPYQYLFFEPRSGLRPLVDSMFESIGAKPSVIAELAEDQVIAGFTAGGFGIAIVPDMPILDTLPVKKLHIEHPTVERRFYVACLKGRTQLPALSSFLSFVREQARSTPYQNV